MNDITQNKLLTFLNKNVNNCRILVIGDLMLDRYFFGEVTRISPEAPVPITLIREKRDTLGGAANVAHNLAKMGCNVFMSGIIGNDHHGHILIHLLNKLNIKNDGLIEGRKQTTTKSRIIGGHQQMLRMDFEEIEPIHKEIEDKLLKYIEGCLSKGLDAIVLSDYHKGVCTESFCQNVIKIAHTNNCLVFVDPKGNEWTKYKNADFVTPNIKETSEVLGKKINNDSVELKKAATKISNEYNIPNVVITRSEKGMSIYNDSEELHLPTVAQDVFDVSGAGDTVISVLALGVAGGLSIYESAELANIAAGIGVGKVGTYAVSRDELKSQLRFNNN